MTTTVNIHHAKTHLSKLVERVRQGEEIVLAKSGTPVAKIVPLTKSPLKRIPGTGKGQVVIADDFDDPLPEEVLRDFEN